MEVSKNSTDDYSSIPYLDSPAVDTHCHLDYLKQLELEKILALSQQKNIEKMITISVNRDNMDTVVSLTERYPQVYGTQGVHPHHASTFDELSMEKIKLNVKKKKILAIGEIGLDYYYNKSPPEVQRLAFERQLDLACELNLPVVIHTRDADDDTLAILKNFSPKLKRKGVLHSFTSSRNLAEFALDQEYFLGFNGIITFKNAENVREIVRLTPLEKILLETDAPFLTPLPFRGKENAPFYLPLVAKHLAEILNLTPQKILPQIRQNTQKLFAL